MAIFSNPSITVALGFLALLSMTTSCNDSSSSASPPPSTPTPNSGDGNCATTSSAQNPGDYLALLTGTTVSYNIDIKPILTQKCAMSGCHSVGSPYTDLSTYALAKAAGTSIISRVSNGSMPKPGIPPLSTTQKQALIAWQAAGYPEASTNTTNTANTSISGSTSTTTGGGVKTTTGGSQTTTGGTKTTASTSTTASGTQTSKCTAVSTGG